IGLPESTKCFTKSTALGFIRNLSGFRTPPGNNNASNSDGSAESSGISTTTHFPHFFRFHPRISPSCGETTLVSAPALSRAFLGLISSTCSNPSSTRIATFFPFRFFLGIEIPPGLSILDGGRRAWFCEDHGPSEKQKNKAPKIRRLFGRRKGDPSPSVEACTLFCPAWRPCPRATPGRQRRYFGDRTRGTARTRGSQQPSYRSAAFESQS